MADAVTSQTLMDGERLAVMKFTNISDGTGESAVLKVDVSALAANTWGQTCTGVSIQAISGDTDGMSVRVLWDATADVMAYTVGPNFTDKAFDPHIANNAGAGKTGDILFTTNGATAGDAYSITLTMVKRYGGV